MSNATPKDAELEIELRKSIELHGPMTATENVLSVQSRERFALSRALLSLSKAQAGTPKGRAASDALKRIPIGRAEVEAEARRHLAPLSTTSDARLWSALAERVRELAEALNAAVAGELAARRDLERRVTALEGDRRAEVAPVTDDYGPPPAPEDAPEGFRRVRADTGTEV